MSQIKHYLARIKASDKYSNTWYLRRANLADVYETIIEVYTDSYPTISTKTGKKEWALDVMNRLMDIRKDLDDFNEMK
tara:strand:- start:355 stop:588 length:234 start_codon:yes stop_codon:yes gene_type:complete